MPCAKHDSKPNSTNKQPSAGINWFLPGKLSKLLRSQHSGRWFLKRGIIKPSYNLEDIRVMKVPAVEELRDLGDGRSLLRRHVSRAANEAAHPM